MPQHSKLFSWGPLVPTGMGWLENRNFEVTSNNLWEPLRKPRGAT